jgi:hypothetical protein
LPLRIPRKLGTYSTRSWALVPRDRGQSFHAIVGSHSTRSWAVIPREVGQLV